MTIVNDELLAAFEAALARNNGSVRAASREIGISRSTSRHWVKFLDAGVQSKVMKSTHLGRDATKKEAAEPFLIAPRVLKKSKFVITSAQNATPVHKAFFASLLVYCKANDAELMVIPYRYKNPTSMFTAEQQDLDWWSAELVPYLFNQRVHLSKNIMVLGDIKIQPTAVSPLSGFETITGSASGIIGAPKLDLTTVATPQKRLPKILTTTGACTMSNYGEGKAGSKGEHHHTYGAAVVEIDGDAFHLRQINAIHDGSFTDLEYDYTPTGRKLAPPPAALILGDLHAEVRDHDVMDATFGKGGIVQTLKPQHIVFHDLIDFTARNHHSTKDPFFRYARHHSYERRHDNIEFELREAFGFLDSVTPSYCKNVIVASNHIDALGRWIRETDPREGDAENALFWTRTFGAMLESTKMTPGGVSTIEPLTYWAQQWMKTAPQTTFLGRGESFMLHGIELAMHGDKGPNGARGSRIAFTKIGVKSVIGHSHSPGISGGVYQVGTNSRLDLSYAAGSPSSWLHTDCVVYANGKRSLINIIGTEWRAKPKKSKPIQLKPVVGTMHPMNVFYSSTNTSI